MYYEDLTIEEKRLVLQEVEVESKNVLIAYLLLLFCGGLGIHHFYLGNKSEGMGQLALTLVGGLTVFILIGFVPLLVVGIWLFLDLFRIPTIIEKQKQQLREKKARELLVP